MASATAGLWAAAICAACAYLVACVAVAWRLGRDSKGRAKWLAVSLAATPLPAIIGLVWRRRRQNHKQAAGGAVVRCRHCGDVVDTAETLPGPPRLCPKCGLVIDEVHLA